MIERRISPWTLLAIAAVAVAYQLPVFDRTMFLMDEGHILQFADMISEGGELYRDANLLPLPGAFYLLALLFDWFGPSILLARWVAVVEFALLCCCAYVILRQIVSRPHAWAGVGLIFLYRVWAFPHWHMYSYSTLAMCLLACALACLQLFFVGGRVAWAAAAGLLTGLSVFTKQDYGTAGLLAMNLALAVRHFSAATRSPERGFASFAWYNAPAVAVGAATAIHFLRQGLFGEMLQQTLLNHLFGIATFEYSSLPPLLPLFAQEPLLRGPYGFATYVPTILFQVFWNPIRASAFYNDTFLWDLGVKLFFYIPYAVVAAACLRVWVVRGRRREPERRTAYLTEVLLTFLATALVLALTKPVDYTHVVVMYWPLLLLLPVFATSFTRRWPRASRVLGAVLALPALAIVTFSGWLGWRLYEEYRTPLRGERTGVYVMEDEERVIGSAVDWVKEHTEPGDRFTVLPYFPLINFLADVDGPHRATYTFWPIEYIENREDQIIEAIEATGNDRLLYHFTQFVMFPRMSEFAPKLFAHLVEHYEIERVFTSVDWGYMMAGLRRSDGPPPGERLDLDPPHVRLWLERPDGVRIPPQPGFEGQLFETALWPFRPVFALRPVSGGRRSVASVEVQVPAGGARLETAIGVHPDDWFAHPPSSVTFEIGAVVDGERHSLFEQTIAPQSDYHDRRWFEVAVDLRAYEGSVIQLEFTGRAERVTGEKLSMGGWEIPRLVPSAEVETEAEARVTH